MSTGIGIVEELKTIMSLMEDVSVILRDAVDEQDWSLVVEAHTLLTGEQLDEPETPDNPGDILAQLMERLSRLENKKSEPDKTKNPKRTSSKAKTVSIQPVKGRINKFEEMTDIIGEVGKDPGFDKIDDKKPVQKKRKRPYKLAKVECARCHKTFEVNPIFVREHYRCDNCIGKE